MWAKEKLLLYKTAFKTPQLTNSLYVQRKSKTQKLPTQRITQNSSSKMTNEITETSQVSEELLLKYIHACHILHNHGIVDAYGHISVRLSPSTFLMSRYIAPPLVTSKDLVIYKVEDGEAVAAAAPRGLYCAPSSAL